MKFRIYNVKSMLVLCFVILLSTMINAQNVAINNSGASADSSAILDVQSTDKGLLIPRMSTIERIAISSPANGLMVYDTTTASFWYCNAGAWSEIGSRNFLHDLDLDTKIMVEESADDDTIRFYTSGQEFAKMDGKTLHIEAPGQSLFIGKDAGKLDNGTNNKNTAIGYEALISNALGDNNIAIGHRTLNSNIGGDFNVASGVEAMYSNTYGIYNSAIGYQALYSNTNGSSNIAVGQQALYSNTFGNHNTAVGREALYSNTSGSRNTSGGSKALQFNTTAGDNTAYGYQALHSNTTGYTNTANGSYSLYLNTTGRFNAAFGFDALRSNTLGDANTAIGYKTLEFNTTGDYNTAIGLRALNINTTGYNNTAIGIRALNVNTTGNRNTAIGYEANMGSDALFNATAIGADAIVNQSNSMVLGNNVNVGIGSSAPSASAKLEISSTNKGLLIPRMTTTERDNISFPAVGLLVYVTNDNMFYAFDGSTWLALNSRTREIIDTDNDTKILVEESPDEDKIRFRLAGKEKWVMQGNSLESVNTGRSVFIGKDAGLNDDLSDNSNVAIGETTLKSNTTGFWNTAIGFESLFENISGNSNTAIGFYSLRENIGSYNTATGTLALTNNIAGGSNSAYGYRALDSNTSGSHNAAIGQGALYSNIIGWFNSAIGSEALYYSTGYHNTANGYRALYNNSSGWRNTATGNEALFNNTQGDNNTALGFEALHSNMTGDNNTMIGSGADVGSGALMNATAIGANAVVYQSNSLVLGNNANVGIGTGSPEVKLQVTGGSDAALASGGFFEIGTSTGANLIFDDNEIIARNNGAASTMHLNRDGGSVEINGLGLGNVAIGSSSSSPSAQLEVTSTTKGILVPRMTTVERNSIVSPADGLLVYVTNDDMFYFYDGTAWLAVNSRTRELIDADNDTKIEVEQSADEDIIRFQLSGTEKWAMKGSRLEPTGAGESVFIGNGAGMNDDLTTNRNVAIGESALFSNTSGYWNTANGYQALYNNTDGIQNTAIGYDALFNNTAGNRNLANGFQSLYNNTIGNWNQASGYQSLYSNTTGGLNLAIGYQSLYNNIDGYWNTAIGREALITNTTGSSNTAIGYKANVGSNNLDNATAIGANAIVSQSNSLVLGNNADVGIGTSTPSEKLHVVGNICYTGSIAACSDIRYKTDFKNFTNVLDNLKEIKGQYYYWNQEAFPTKDFSDERQIGVIAQEVEKCFPEIVLTDKDGFKSVDYSRLTPILLEAIKEQQEMIEKLSLENEEIRVNNEEMRSENANIKNDVSRIKAALEIEN